MVRLTAGVADAGAAGAGAAEEAPPPALQPRSAATAAIGRCRASVSIMGGDG